MPAGNSSLSIPFLDRLSTKVALAAVVFLFALASAVAFLVAAGFRRIQYNAYNSTREALADQSEASLAQLAVDQAQLLEAHLVEAQIAVRHAVGYLGANQAQAEATSPEAARLETYLRHVQQDHPDMQALYYIHSQGAIVNRPDDSPPVTGVEWLSSPAYQLAAPPANPGHAAVWFGPFVKLPGNERLVTVSAPVYVGATFHGVVAAEVPLVHLEQHLDSIQLIPSSYAFLVDRGGNLVSIAAEGRRSLLGVSGSALEPQNLPGEFLQALAKVSTGGVGTENIELNGHPFQLAYAPLNEIDWSLALATPLQALTTQSEQVANNVWSSAEATIRSTLFMVLLFFIGALLGTLLFADRFISRRVAALFKGVRAISAGEMDVTVALGSADELGMLAEAFNQMAAELRRGRSELLQANSELRRSEELYRTLARNFPNGAVLLYDHDLRYILADGNGLGEVGLSREQLEGHTIWEVFPPETCELIEPPFRQALEGFESTLEVPFAGRTYLVWALPTRNEQGKIFGGMVMTQNITERTLQQQILEQRVAESTAEIKQLYERSEGRSRELEALYLADEQLYRHLRLDQVLQALTDVVIDQLEADKASVQVWDSVRQRLAVRASRGYSPGMIARMNEYMPGDGISGKVFQSGQVIAVEDATKAPYPANEIAAVEGISSVLSVPITIGGQVYGVFGMDYCRPRSFTGEDKRLFLALAQRAAIAIQNARLYEQAEQAAALVERQRLARELHDAVTQSLYSLVLLSEAGRRYAKTGNTGQVEHHLNRLSETAQQALKEMRLLVYELRPLALQEVGLAGALRQRLEAVEKRAGIQAHLFLEGLTDLPIPLDEELYRIAQEALNNSLKHARASEVSVLLHRRPDSLVLQVKDNGNGFEPGEGDNGGIGLKSMRERAERMGAILEIESAPGEGATVRLQVNLNRLTELENNAKERR